MKALKRLTLLIFCLGTFTVIGQEGSSGNKGGVNVDNNITFMVVSEKVKTRGMMEMCVTDTSGMCISNLQSGMVIRVFDEANQEIWAGKTAGRESMLKFPKPMPEAAYLVFTAFKPYVLNVATGNRIYQDEPIELKYILKDE